MKYETCSNYNNKPEWIKDGRANRVSQHKVHIRLSSSRVWCSYEYAKHWGHQLSFVWHVCVIVSVCVSRNEYFMRIDSIHREHELRPIFGAIQCVVYVAARESWIQWWWFRQYIELKFRHMGKSMAKAFFIRVRRETSVSLKTWILFNEILTMLIYFLILN